MFFNHRYTHLVILLINFVVGLGLALAIPWLANTQCKASEDIPTFPPNIVGLVKPPNRNVLPPFDNNGTEFIPIPIACWATHNNGEDVFTALIGSSSVQQAVDAASPGDTVKVAGTCMGGESRAGFTQTVYISKPLTLQGGYRNDYWTLPADPTNFSTTLNAYNVGRVVVVSGTQDVTLDSLILKRGLANDGTLDEKGGGIWTNSEMTLTNSMIYSNTARCGGGMYNQNVSPILNNVTFINNFANFEGGAMHNNGLEGESSPTLNNVTFSGNEAMSGGAISNYGYQGTSSPILTNVIFSSNKARYRGGAMWNLGSYQGECNPILTNVIFSGNKAKYGGAMHNYCGYDSNCSPKLTNVTFSGNSAEIMGGAMYNFGECKPYVRNSILWKNQDYSGGGTISATIYNKDATVFLTYSLLQNSFPNGNWVGGSYEDGGGNIDTNPMFVTPINPTSAPTTSGNLRLQSGSPAINAGKNAFLTEPKDLDGNDRILDGIVDMGAYETMPISLLPLIIR